MIVLPIAKDRGGRDARVRLHHQHGGRENIKRHGEIIADELLRETAGTALAWRRRLTNAGGAVAPRSHGAATFAPCCGRLAWLAVDPLPKKTPRRRASWALEGKIVATTS
jgi:hypothetical protein